MTTETMKQEIAELEAQGWKPDNAPRAVEKHYEFPDYSGAVNFLIALGKALASSPAAIPAIHIESGTDVTVRLGGAPVRTISADEIALAKALAQEEPSLLATP